MAFTYLNISRAGAVATVHMNRNAENSLDRTMLLEIGDAFCELNDDRSVRVAILASAQSRFYCNGVDLHHLLQLPDAERATTFAELFQTTLRLYRLDLPVIAAINGLAMAGGAVLSLTADYRLAAEQARWSLTEIRVGLPLPACVQVALREALAVPDAQRLGFSGAIVKPGEGLAMGLFREVFNDSEFSMRCQRFAEKVAELPNDMFRDTKRNWREASRAAMALAVEKDIAAARGLITSANALEGIASVVEKRRPVFNK